MARPLKVRKFGSSLGLVLPKDLLSDLGIGEGDYLYPVRTPDGIKLTVQAPELFEVVEDGRSYMRRHRKAMTKLAN